MNISHYDTLGIQPNATEFEVRQAWRYACKNSHPDREGGSHEAQAAVNEAYRVLSDPELRANYDATGSAHHTSMEDRGQGAMLSAFHNALMSDADDPVDAARTAMLTERTEINNTLVAAAQRRKKLEKQRAKIKMHADGENLLTSTINQLLAIVANDVARMEDRGAVLDAGIKVLGNYDFSKPAKGRVIDEEDSWWNSAVSGVHYTRGGP